MAVIVSPNASHCARSLRASMKSPLWEAIERAAVSALCARCRSRVIIALSVAPRALAPATYGRDRDAEPLADLGNRLVRHGDTGDAAAEVHGRQPGALHEPAGGELLDWPWAGGVDLEHEGHMLVRLSPITVDISQTVSS